jgi:hypothetical protein
VEGGYDLSIVLQVEYSLSMATDFNLRIYTADELIASTVKMVFPKASIVQLENLLKECRNITNFGTATYSIYQEFSIFEIVMASIESSFEIYDTAQGLLRLNTLLEYYAFNKYRISLCKAAIYHELNAEVSHESSVYSIDPKLGPESLTAISTISTGAESPSTSKLIEKIALVNISKCCIVGNYSSTRIAGMKEINSSSLLNIQLNDKNDVGKKRRKGEHVK